MKCEHGFELQPGSICAHKDEFLASLLPVGMRAQLRIEQDAARGIRHDANCSLMFSRTFCDCSVLDAPAEQQAAARDGLLSPDQIAEYIDNRDNYELPGDMEMGEFIAGQFAAEYKRGYLAGLRAGEKSLPEGNRP